MCSNPEPAKNEEIEPYIFQPFNFEKVKPSNKRRWELPWARSGHRIVCNDSCIYVYGGYQPQYVDPDSGLSREYLFNELWQFNIMTRKWRLLPGQETIPPELASVAVLFDGRTLLVYGGTSLPFGLYCSNKMFYCTLTKDQFYHGMQQINAKGSKPPGLYGQAILCLNGYIYTIGGTSGEDFTCDIHRLDLKTNTWEEVYIETGSEEYAPEPRYRHEIACDGTFIYLFGGGTKYYAFDLEYIPAFNTKTRVWTKMQTFKDENDGIPAPRMCHSCVQFTDPDTKEIFVFIVGGSDGLDTYFNCLWRLELRTMCWKHITKCTVPHRVFFNAACITKAGKLFIFGGINPDNLYKRTNDLHSTWVVVPKLSEMCWEAMLHYFEPKLHKLKMDELLNMGVPKHFVERLHNYL